MHLIFSVMDNGPAKKSGHAQKLQLASELIGDPFEISTIRREDFASHKGVSEGDDVVQGQSKPSTQSDRGHQGINSNADHLTYLIYIKIIYIRTSCFSYIGIWIGQMWIR